MEGISYTNNLVSLWPWLGGVFTVPWAYFFPLKRLTKTSILNPWGGFSKGLILPSLFPKTKCLPVLLLEQCGSAVFPGQWAHSTNQGKTYKVVGKCCSFYCHMNHSYMNGCLVIALNNNTLKWAICKLKYFIHMEPDCPVITLVSNYTCK